MGNMVQDLPQLRETADLPLIFFFFFLEGVNKFS
jgi:hypothetical protein